jgi:hypothetical protein
MEPVVVYRTFNIADAHVVRASLESAGFHPEVINEIASLTMEGYSMAGGGVRVLVPSEEAEDALALIASTRNSPSE